MSRLLLLQFEIYCISLEINFGLQTKHFLCYGWNEFWFSKTPESVRKKKKKIHLLISLSLANHISDVVRLVSSVSNKMEETSVGNHYKRERKAHRGSRLAGLWILLVSVVLFVTLWIFLFIWLWVNVPIKSKRGSRGKGRRWRVRLKVNLKSNGNSEHLCISGRPE